MQRVSIVCSACGHENVRLAAAVKRGGKIRCESCRKTFVAADLRPLIGASAPLPKRR